MHGQLPDIINIELKEFTRYPYYTKMDYICINMIIVC